jgi:hypothetical protein
MIDPILLISASVSLVTCALALSVRRVLMSEWMRRTVKYWRVTYEQSSPQERIEYGLFAFMAVWLVFVGMVVR